MAMKVVNHHKHPKIIKDNCAQNPPLACKPIYIPEGAENNKSPITYMYPEYWWMVLCFYVL